MSFDVCVKRDLCRLARFGANLSDSHSCFIFLPANILLDSSSSLGAHTSELSDQLELAGFHSFSQDVLHAARIGIGTGLIGWVAKHGKAIHVSPFERDSRTLGIYTNDQQLKSFIGVPVPFAPVDGADPCYGVIACDSKKSFAFSKIQGKLIEDLSAEISNTLRLHLRSRAHNQSSSGWHEFLRDSLRLSDSLGRDSLEILRLKLKNFAEIENALGTADCVKLVQQLQRLVKQTLPAHFPLLCLPNGDIVIALDVMASSFYENRINAVCSHISSVSQPPVLEFCRASFRDKRFKGATIERLITDSAQGVPVSRAVQGELLYEYRRA